MSNDNYAEICAVVGGGNRSEMYKKKEDVRCQENTSFYFHVEREVLQWKLITLLHWERIEILAIGTNSEIYRNEQ